MDTSAFPIWDPVIGVSLNLTSLHNLLIDSCWSSFESVNRIFVLIAFFDS